MKIPGVDPIILNQVKNQTAKKVVHESREARVSGEKKERQGGRGHQGKQDRRALERSLELLNQAMEAAGRPLRFQLIERNGTIMVQIIDSFHNKLIRQVPPEKVLGLVGRVRDMIGLMVDELI